MSKGMNWRCPTHGSTIPQIEPFLPAARFFQINVKTFFKRWFIIIIFTYASVDAKDGSYIII